MTTHPEPACRPHVKAGRDLWHQPAGSGISRRAENARIYEAKTICGACPLRAACLAAATDDDDGIWGGLTRYERRTGIVRPRPKPRDPATCGTTAGYRRHRRAGEATCDDCREAQRLASRRSRAKRAKGAA